MPEKKCPKCGEMVDSVDLDDPCDNYFCDCGWEECDTIGWGERMADHADFLRKQYKEGV